MAGMALSTEIVELLETLKLTNFYPENLSRDELYEITCQSLVSKSERTCPLPWQFIYDISRYNYRARNLETSQDLSTNLSKMGLRERIHKKDEQKQSTVHPLDVLVIVFMCCEPTARQDLVMHLWGCKLAIPFITKISKTENLRAYIWPLRSLVGQFNDAEKPLVDVKNKIISFIRIGMNRDMSKSNLINCFICGPEKAHPIFFHRDCEGSKKTRSNIVNGLIELGWFLPKGSDTDKFSSPRLFLNLRGDAKYLKEQVQILGEMSTIAVLICTEESLGLNETQNIIGQLLKELSSVLVMLSDKEAPSAVTESVLQRYSDFPDHVFDVVATTGLRLWEILKCLHHNVDKMCKKSKKEKSLMDIYCSKSINIDEREDPYKLAFKSTDSIIKKMLEVGVDDRKTFFLPLQEKYWKEWAKLDRDFHRFGQLETHVKEKYGNQKFVETEMKKVRKKQKECLNSNTHFLPMETFLSAIVSMDATRRRIFLRYLKLELDNMSRFDIIPFYKQYHELLVQQENVASEEERNKVLEKLSKLDVTRAKMSFGLEHFVREMGQIFEACESTNTKPVKVCKLPNGKSIYHYELLEAACVLLKEGYPLEILDGEAASVPILWVQKILAILPGIIADKRDLNVHIISVLGIQSSGKSTFLNTLFGLQFTVSAGRCTRGAFMQLVKVGTDLRKKIDTDYVLAVDTEGLKSAELTSSEYIKHDNELSTFVIGLADTTVINLMGENASYLQDNLPIAVHAFLRMNLVGLHPRCIIVHHNVDKRNKDKLLQQGHFLETTLNKHTQMACEIEKIPHKLFKDIIEFNISKHTDYIPALLEGERPMAPISIGYSSETDLVRVKLVEFVQPSSDLSKLSQFSRHLENLWKAIKRDRFVYEFKTTLETEARITLDNNYYKILDEYAIQLEQVNINIRQKIDVKKDLDSFKAKYLKETKSIETTYFKKLSKYFEKPKKVKTERISAWEKDYQTNLKTFFHQNKTSDLKDIEICYAQKKGDAIESDQLKHFFLLYAKYNALSTDEETAFDKSWDEWKVFNSPKKYNVLSDTENALKNICPAHKYLLSEKAISKSFLEGFHPSVAIHVNNPGKSRSSDESLLLKMNNILQTVLLEYNTKLSSIKQSQLPYSQRKPLVILLAVEKHLQHRLSTEDSNNEINNIFRIDTLLCTAGSCVRDLERMNRNDEQYLTLRAKIKELVKKSKNTFRGAISMLKRILKISVNRSLHLNSALILRASLIKSKWTGIVKDKQSLLGNCLKTILLEKDNELLLKYVHYPKEAILSYFTKIVVSVLESSAFQCECLYFSEVKAKRFMELVEKSLDKNRRFISPKMLIQTIVSDLDLNLPDKQLILLTIQQKEELQNDCVFDAREILNEMNLQKVKYECYDTFKTEKLKEESLSVMVTNLSAVLIGCQKQCPFCKEICRYTEQHPGKHECYIHRPVGCAGLHWHETKQLSYETCPQHIERKNMFMHNNSWVSFCDYETVYPEWKLSTINPSEPSLLWKFIFIKKYSVLRAKYELPENLPDDWNLIEEHEILKELGCQFRLEIETFV